MDKNAWAEWAEVWQQKMEAHTTKMALFRDFQEWMKSQTEEVDENRTLGWRYDRAKHKWQNVSRSIPCPGPETPHE